MTGTASEPRVGVRLAASSDVAAIVAFGAVVVPPHYTPILGAAAAQSQVDHWWTPERMAAAAVAGRVHVAIGGRGLAGEQLIGVVETGTYGDDQVIWKLYLAPQARGRGLGVELLDRAVAALPTGTGTRAGRARCSGRLAAPQPALSPARRLRRGRSSAGVAHLATEVVDLVAQACGVLEAQLGGRLVHLRLQGLDEPAELFLGQAA